MVCVTVITGRRLPDREVVSRHSSHRADEVIETAVPVDVVFTLPSAISDIAYQNKAVIYDLLFMASAKLTIAADPKHLGARIGITSASRSRSKRRHVRSWRKLTLQRTCFVGSF
jgi:hypothetical protein